MCRLLLVCHSEGESPKNLILKFEGVNPPSIFPPKLRDPSLPLRMTPYFVAEFTLSEANVLRMTGKHGRVLGSFPLKLRNNAFVPSLVKKTFW